MNTNISQQKLFQPKNSLKQRANNLQKKWSIQTAHQTNPQTIDPQELRTFLNQKQTKKQSQTHLEDKKLTTYLFLDMTDEQFKNKYQENAYFRSKVQILADQCKRKGVNNKQQQTQKKYEGGNCLNIVKLNLLKDLHQFIIKYNRVIQNK